MTDIATPSNINTRSVAARPVAIANWLFFVAFLVFIMVVVGGITRLTESGLSITEWKPITGAIPPLNQADWLSEFEKYKQIPEYTEVSGPAGMTLADFKFIYFWEWVHRLLGRVVGLAILLPWLFFAGCAVLRYIMPAISERLPALPKGYTLRIFALGALVAMQGTIGWWMVSSGLTQLTDVSHFRLAAHLLTALFILGGLVWTALDLRRLAAGHRRSAKLTGIGLLVFAVIFIQFLFGAYVAGLNAGYVSNTWPLMNDKLVPDGIDFTFGALNALNNDPYLTHFVHRWWAWVAVAFLIILARKVRVQSRLASVAIHSAFGVQILLGIGTVMSGVNINLAVLHQAVGALVIAATVWGVHILGRQNLDVLNADAMKLE